MSAKYFTAGIYEDRRVYFYLLAQALRQFVKDGVVDEIFVVWYRLNETLADWTRAVANGEAGTNPFGEEPYVVHLEKDNYLLPGETSDESVDSEALDWDGQKDIPESLKAQTDTPSKFRVVTNIVQCPRPNLIVVDHQLFRPDTAEATLSDGCAHLITKGLTSFYKGEANTPPIFLSSRWPLAGQVGLDVLGAGRGRGPGIRWFPRSEESKPSKLPEGFEQALREEIGFWARNRQLLGAKYDRFSWPSYSPPFDRVLVCNQSGFTLNLYSELEVVHRTRPLSVDDDADALLARHCKAYLEIQTEVKQEHLERLRRLAERLPIPIVLLYWNTSKNVSSLAECGVLVELVRPSKVKLEVEFESRANNWIHRMIALDTVVGGDRIVQIRDDLLRWRSAMESVRRRSNPFDPIGQGVLIAGPTGAGKTATSKWCHLFSNHVVSDTNALNRFWADIRVPSSKKGFAVGLGNVASVADSKLKKEPAHGTAPKAEDNQLDDQTDKDETTDAKTNVDIIKIWAKTLIKHGGGVTKRGKGLAGLLDSAFVASSRQPWQVNLVGVTRDDEFVMQVAGAYPAWTGNVGMGDWRPGAVLNATNSSLILNEVGELSPRFQGLLLELIERGGPIRPMFAPIDGEIKARNVLFVLATDREDLIREQLLHRCRVIRVPSLLECQEDIPELTRHRLLPRWCCLSEVAEQLLKNWPYWPGNHRSLHAVLDFASEGLASSRRVIGVTEIMRALWRANLFRVPTRLETLVEWILDWPELSTDAVENVIPTVAEHLTRIGLSDDGSLIDDLTRISEVTFENPSAHFSDLLQLDEQREKLRGLRSVLQEMKLARGDDLYRKAADVAAQDLGDSISLANLALRSNITIDVLTDLLQSLEDKGTTPTGSAQDLRDIKDLLFKVLRLYVHEIFWTLEKRTSRIRRAIAAAKSAPKKKPLELLSDQEQRLTTGFRDDALIILSLGTLLWKVVHLEPKDIAEANKLILNRPTKPSGRKKADGGVPPTTTPATEANPSSQTEKLPSKTEKATRQNHVPSYGDSKISTTAKDAGQYALAVIKAVDNRTGHGLLDYSEDRKTRAYFGQGLDIDDDDDEDDE